MFDDHRYEDMMLISKYDKRDRFVLCAIDVFSKYAWVVPLKGNKYIKITNVFQKVSDKPSLVNRKPDKILVDKGREFYNKQIKSRLQDNDIEIYSTHNKMKSNVTERFMRKLKNKICKCIASISKNVYIDKLDDIVDKYNNAYHRTINMKPININ